MKKNRLDELESRLLNSRQAKEINNELAEEFLMADLYSGFHPQEALKESEPKNES